MAVQFSGKTPIDWNGMELSIPEGEQRLVKTSLALFSVEYVQVFNRHRPDGFCSIYGEITFTNEGCDSFLTMFKRSQDGPASIDLSDPYFQSLTLSDDGLNAPPCIYSGFPILVKMELFEKKQPAGSDDGDDQSYKSVDDGGQSSSSQIQNPKGVEPKSADEDHSSAENEQSEGEDTCIARIDFTMDECYEDNERYIIEFEGMSGFVIHVAFAFIQGCVPVGVRFTINEKHLEEGQGQGDSVAVPDNVTGKRKRSIDIYGIIAAVQEMGTSPSPAIKLFYKSESDPGQVSLGSPIHLDRTFLVAPVTEGYLCIAYTLFRADNNTVIAEDVVPFPIDISHARFFVTDKNLSHTRQSKDGIISISLKFMTPLEAVDPSDPSTKMKPISDYDKLN